MSKPATGARVRAFPWQGAGLLAACALIACTAGPGASSGAASAWTQITADMAGVTLSDVTPSGTGFEAVGTALGASNAQKGEAFKSPDGRTWTAAGNDPFKDATLGAVGAAHGGLVAVGAGGCSLECGGFESWLSTDGITWMGPIGPPVPDVARGIGLVEEGSTIVAIATELLDPSVNKNRGRVYLSTDAKAWMDPLTADALAQVSPAGIATDDGTGVVIVGSTISEAGTHTGGAWRSTDGHSWSAATDDGSFKGALLMAVVHGSGGYIAVGTTGADGAVWSSSDGATWTRVDGGAFAGSPLADVAANGAGYIAIGRGANGGAAWTSADGKTWRSVGTIQGSEGMKFVAVAIGSTASIIVGGAAGTPSGLVWLGPVP